MINRGQVHLWIVVCPDGRVRALGQDVPVAMTRDDARSLVRDRDHRAQYADELACCGRRGHHAERTDVAELAGALPRTA